MPLFKPNYYLSGISDLTPRRLSLWGIKGLILDVDNTLAAQDAPHLPKEIDTWLKAAKEMHLPMIILSNNKPERVAPFAKKVGLPFVARAAKPLPFGFAKGVKLLGLKKESVAAVGDQILTDIIGSNLCGVKSILTDPLKEETEGFLATKRRWQKNYLNRKKLTPLEKEQEGLL